MSSKDFERTAVLGRLVAQPLDIRTQGPEGPLQREQLAAAVELMRRMGIVAVDKKLPITGPDRRTGIEGRTAMKKDIFPIPEDKSSLGLHLYGSDGQIPFGYKVVPDEFSQVPRVNTPVAQAAVEHNLLPQTNLAREGVGSEGRVNDGHVVYGIFQAFQLFDSETANPANFLLGEPDHWTGSISLCLAPEDFSNGVEIGGYTAVGLKFIPADGIFNHGEIIFLLKPEEPLSVPSLPSPSHLLSSP